VPRNRKIHNPYPQDRGKTLLADSVACLKSEAKGKEGVVKRPQKTKIKEFAKKGGSVESLKMYSSNVSM
jgi:hypothetical protein